MKLDDTRGNAHAMLNAGIREQLEVTSRAVVAADESYVRESLADAYPGRQGVLQRLTHPDPSARELWRRAFRVRRLGGTVAEPSPQPETNA